MYLGEGGALHGRDAGKVPGLYMPLENARRAANCF